MKINILSAVVITCFIFAGCQTVHDTGEKGGEYIGKGADAIGGITEGAAEGYGGVKPTKEENPYDR